MYTHVNTYYSETVNAKSRLSDKCLNNISYKQAKHIPSAYNLNSQLYRREMAYLSYCERDFFDKLIPDWDQKVSRMICFFDVS